MGKVLKAVVGVGLIATAIFTGGITFTGGLAFLGTISGGAIAAVGASLALSSLAPRPRLPETQLARLNVRMEAGAVRKMVFGTTAFPLDLRYHEGTGSEQEFIHYIIAHAAHKVQSIDQIWFEQDLAWSASGGVTSKYSGFLTVTTRTEGAAGNEIAISGNWGSGERLTGCAYTYLRIKRTGGDSKTESPLVSGLPSRVTIIGEGLPLYDPRLDSTVTGGSGAHRIDDQTTWGASYSPADSHDNPALHLLAFLIGWRINDKLSVGAGVPSARLDIDSFLVAANICDEAITLSAGGTQPRYRTSGTISDADDPLEVINTLLANMNGTLRDTNGRLSLEIIKNDLADYVLDLDDNDLLGEFSWKQTRGLAQTPNAVRGRFVDPSDASLYQLVEYPEVSIASPDGVPRVLNLDLGFVEDANRAQRIAKQVLQRQQYQGTFTGEFTAKALGCEVGEVVRLSLETLGWSNKLFRVIAKGIRMDGRVPLTLIEENAAIYAWDEEESAPVTAAAPTVYNPLNNPFILALADFSQIAEDAEAAAQIALDALEDIADDNVLDAGEKADVRLERRKIEEEYPIIRARAITAGVAVSTYDTEYDDLIDYLDTLSLGSNTSTSISRSTFISRFADYFEARQTVLDGIAEEAAQTAIWDQIDGTGKPEDDADVSRTIGGPTLIELSADIENAAQNLFPVVRNYVLEDASGFVYPSGVTWAERVVSGEFTGTNPTITNNGLGELRINSGLETNEAIVEIGAVQGDKSWGPLQVVVRKAVAGISTEKQGAQITVKVEDTAVGNVPNSATYTPISKELEITAPSGTGTFLLHLPPLALSVANSSSSGATAIQMAWYRKIGASSWTKEGPDYASNPDPSISFDTGARVPEPGVIGGATTIVGTSAGATETFQLWGRRTSGVARAVEVIGGISITSVGTP